MKTNRRQGSSSPYFSIIIPAKDAEDTLSRAVESLLVQNDVENEILIIENGSSDRTLEIAKHYEMIDSRVRAFHLDEANISNARNLGLDQASGEYILFCDADDWYLPFALTRFRDALDENRVDLLFAFAEFHIIPNSDKVIPIEASALINSAFFTGLGISEENPYKIGEITPIPRPWGIAYRRFFIEKYGLRFDTRCRTMQDFLFNMECLTKDCYVRILDCPVYHYSYRLNSNCRRNDINMFNDICDFIIVFLERLYSWKLDRKQTFDAHIFILDRMLSAISLSMSIEHTKAANNNTRSFLNRAEIQTLLKTISESNPYEKDIRSQLYRIAATALLEGNFSGLLIVKKTLGMLNIRDFPFLNVKLDLRLSVICHLYNSAETAIRLIDSFRNQTIPDIELIIIDDRGQGHSMKILREASKMDKRIKILTNRAHLGTAASYNAGMAFAHAKYLFFLNENDEFENDYLEKLLQEKEARILFRRDNLIGKNNRFVNTSSELSPILCNHYDEGDELPI